MEFAEVRGDTLYLLLLGGETEIHVTEKKKVRKLFKQLVVNGYLVDSMLAGMEVEEVDV